MSAERDHLGHELFDTLEGTTTNRLLRDPTEPEFELIEPGCVRRRVVDMTAGTHREPYPAHGMFVGGIVVGDQMDIPLLRYTGIEMAQEGEEPMMAMASPRLTDDGPGSPLDKWGALHFFTLLTSIPADLVRHLQNGASELPH